MTVSDTKPHSTKVRRFSICEDWPAHSTRSVSGIRFPFAWGAAMRAIRGTGVLYLVGHRMEELNAFECIAERRSQACRQHGMNGMLAVSHVCAIFRRMDAK